MRFKPIYKRKLGNGLSKDLFIIENTNFKEGVDHNDLIKVIKNLGVSTVEFVSYLYTNEGRKDMVIAIDKKDSRTLNLLLYHDYENNHRWYRQINRHVKEWKYYGMGKVYHPKDVKAIHDKFKIHIEER